MPSYAAIGLRNVNSVPVVGAKDQGGRETGSKGDFESDESGLHSAFPVFLIERRHPEQQQLQDGAFPQSTQTEENAAVLNLKSKESEGFYVVFNNVREGESNCKESGTQAVLAGGDVKEYNAVDHGNTKKPKDAIMEPHILNSEEKVPTLVNASVSCSNLKGESEQVDRETAATPGLMKQSCFSANCESIKNNNMMPVAEFNNDNSDVYHAPDKNIFESQKQGKRRILRGFQHCSGGRIQFQRKRHTSWKHDDDRRFTCKEEGCGKSFTRAEHLKGHSITHLGTKPFECSVEGCCAKFSARSSLYIHSKKHLQDGETLKSHCPISSCSKQFTSKSSMKTHMVKHHNFSPDLLSQLEITSSLTPSNELTSSGQGDLGNIDMTSLFSSVPANTPGIAMDMSLVNSGILTIDAASVGATLGGGISVNNSSLTQTVDPLILAAGTDVTHGLDSSLALGTNSTVLQQGTLNLDDVQTVNPEALGSLAALSMRTPSQDPLHGLTIDTATLTPSSSLGASHVPELLTPTKVERSLLASSDVIGQQEGSKAVTQFVFSSPTGSYSAQKELELNTVSGCSFLESGGSARTDYRAIQLAKKKKKQKGSSSPGGSSSNQRKTKIIKGNCTPAATTNPSSRFSGGVVSPNSGLTMRDPATGAQYVQLQLLQDDSPGDGDLAFQLSSQSSSSLPVNILQEPHTSTEDDAGSDNSQFTGSTINLQDLE
ncbi:UNVERIFIED_CONTAM: hypothetical protein FKN15_047454 [Acipenser sinensis]